MTVNTPKEYIGELRLWQAAVWQTVYDALTKKKQRDSSGRAAQAKSIAMLEATGGILKVDFELMCSFASLCPIWVRKSYKEQRDTVGYVRNKNKRGQV